MTDRQDTTPRDERKETPAISVSAFIERTTKIGIEDLSSGDITLDFKGERYGGVTLFMTRGTLERMHAVIAEFLA